MDKEKKLIANRILTPDGTILWSRYGHDYVGYTDENGEHYFVDGGNNYCRTSVNKEHPATPIPVFDDEPWEIQRNYRLWGSSGMWIPVACLSNEHIENIIEDGYRNEGVHMEYYYRAKHHIIIPEHDYTNEQALPVTKFN